jgi:hypothetical protein
MNFSQNYILTLLPVLINRKLDSHDIEFELHIIIKKMSSGKLATSANRYTRRPHIFLFLGDLSIATAGLDDSCRLGQC